MYTLDTNAVIYHLAGEPSVVDFFSSTGREYAVYHVSSVTETELFSKKQLIAHEFAQINDFLTQCNVVPITSPIARMAGKLRSLYGIKLADSLIAATALFTGSALVTRNVKDFQKMPGLEIVAL